MNKTFLIIEHDQDRHEDIRHLVTGATFADALKQIPYDERIQDYLSYCYTAEAFPPTRMRKGKVVSLIHFDAPGITAYEIVGRVKGAQELLNTHVADELEKGVEQEKKRRQAK